jgi:stringent starvation protein B
MIDAPDTTSTRPYLIRALHEWCTDNGFTPYVAVVVDDSVRVPREYVKDGEIVLNLSFDATSSLKLGNEFVEFKARFAGTAREIVVPVNQISAIYARENGQGMAFPLAPPKGVKAAASPSVNLVSVPESDHAGASEVRGVQLASVESDRRNDEANDEPDPPRPSTTGVRPALKRVK